MIDGRRRAGDRVGHFLLLGSASLDLMRQSSESLAGRAAYVELATIVAGDLPGTLEDTTDRRNAVTASRGLRLACDVLQPRQAFLVHGGSGEWPAADPLIEIGGRAA